MGLALVYARRTSQVLSQLERSGRGSHETYNADAYEILADHLASRPMKDGDKWLAELIAKNKLLGCRISEVCPRQTSHGQLYLPSGCRGPCLSLGRGSPAKNLWSFGCWDPCLSLGHAAQPWE